jgi:hypothetical protein
MLPVRMLTIGMHILVSAMTVSPSLPADADLLASTYEQAAGDPSDSGECAPAGELELSLPTPGAILDCNDARINVLLGDMIGTCDMPRRSGPQLPPTVHTGSTAPQLRISDGPRGHDRCPLRSPPRANDPPSIVPTRVPLVPPLAVSPLLLHDSPLPVRAEDLRLERPPRA